MASNETLKQYRLQNCYFTEFGKIIYSSIYNMIVNIDQNITIFDLLQKLNYDITKIQSIKLNVNFKHIDCNLYDNISILKNYDIVLIQIFNCLINKLYDISILRSLHDPDLFNKMAAEISKRSKLIGDIDGRYLYILHESYNNLPTIKWNQILLTKKEFDNLISIWWFRYTDGCLMRLDKKYCKIVENDDYESYLVIDIDFFKWKNKGWENRASDSEQYYMIELKNKLIKWPWHLNPYTIDEQSYEQDHYVLFHDKEAYLNTPNIDYECYDVIRESYLLNGHYTPEYSGRRWKSNDIRNYWIYEEMINKNIKPFDDIINYYHEIKKRIIALSNIKNINTSSSNTKN